MFTKPTDKGEFETIIGPSVKVEGDFIGEGNVIVQGTLNGSLKTQKNVLVAEHAKITANITAGSAKISGEVMGNVTVTDRLDLTGTARINGDLQGSVISIEAGAVFNGKCTMTSKPQS